MPSDLRNRSFHLPCGIVLHHPFQETQRNDFRDEELSCQEVLGTYRIGDYIITPHSSRKRAPDEEKEEEDSRAKVSPQSLFIASPPPLK